MSYFPVGYFPGNHFPQNYFTGEYTRTMHICFVPVVGGTQSIGRKMSLGFSMQRLSDNKFLDPATGVWSVTPVVARLKERGRDDAANLSLRGSYVPETPIVNQEEWHDCEHIILYHNLNMDSIIVGKEVRYPSVMAPTTDV